MRGHWFWDFAFLNSNYHLEHHYFAGVPCYRLPALQRALAPFFERHHMRWQNYSGLVHGWLVENRAPHTNWSLSRHEVNEVSDAPHAGSHIGSGDLGRTDAGLRNIH
jgi:fatty acid desaturase